jgi:hypothetical protein
MLNVDVLHHVMMLTVDVLRQGREEGMEGAERVID